MGKVMFAWICELLVWEKVVHRIHLLLSAFTVKEIRQTTAPRRKSQQQSQRDLPWSQGLEAVPHRAPWSFGIHNWESEFHAEKQSVAQKYHLRGSAEACLSQPLAQPGRRPRLARPAREGSGKAHLTVNVSGGSGSLLSSCPYRLSRGAGSYNFQEDDSCLEGFLWLHF